jgi:phosphatidylglycerophosphate synthase
VPGPGAGWSALHHDIDPARVPLLGAWLRLMWWLARPLVRLSVAPLAITCVGVVLAVDALLLAAREPWLGLVLVLAAALCDGLDGAVAVLAHRASRLGSLADKVADRIADTCFALLLWRSGAPLWLALLAGGLSLVHELIRTIRGGALLARITVAERPTRVICAVLACASAGASAATWPQVVCGAVWCGLAAIGLVQLVSAA